MSLPRNAQGKFITKMTYQKKSLIKKTEFTNILIRIPKSYLERIDHALNKKEWGNRTQWIIQAVEAKLNEDI